MSKSSISLKEVARLAGVSVATVSRVLNNADTVKESTRALVQKAIKSTGYQPNRLAQRLRSVNRPRRLIGLLIPDIQNPFYVDVIRGVEEFAYANESAVLIGNFSQDRKKERLYIDILRSESVDGLIVAPASTTDEYVESLLNEGFPAVCIDRGLTHTEVDVVMVDNYKGAFDATEHLINIGHRRIAHITGNPEIPTTRDRVAGYEAALEKHGLPIDHSLIVGRDSDFESGVALAGQLIDAPQPPSAIFAGNNLLTLGVFEAVLKRGLKVPEDVAILGFDDVYWANSFNPALTAVRQPGFDIGRNAVELLYQRIADPQRETVQVIMKTKLMIRKSCGYKENL